MSVRVNMLAHYDGKTISFFLQKTLPSTDFVYEMLASAGLFFYYCIGQRPFSIVSFGRFGLWVRVAAFWVVFTIIVSLTLTKPLIFT